MLETLIVLTCQFGNTDACVNAGTAYYKYYRLDDYVSTYADKTVLEPIKKNYPNIIFSASVASFIFTRDASFALTNGFSLGINLKQEDQRFYIGWTRGF